MLFERLAVVLARLNALAAAEGEWNGALLALIQELEEPYTPSSTMTFAGLELAEATFTGYARSTAIVWGTAYADANKRAVLAGGSKQFSATGSAVSNVVTGYAVINAAEDDVLWAELFDEPRLMDENADALIVIPKYVYGRIQAA